MHSSLVFSNVNSLRYTNIESHVDSLGVITDIKNWRLRNTKKNVAVRLWKVGVYIDWTVNSMLVL